MKKIIPLLLTLALCILAADVWQSKPFTDWSDKDVQKLLTNSSWAREVSISLGGGPGGGSGKGGGKRGGGGGGDMSGGESPVSGPGNGGGNAGSRGGNLDPGASLGASSSLMLTVRWQSALPIRQAIAKQKYGAEAATLPDAKKLVEDSPKYYAIIVSGLPGRMLRASEEMKANLLKETTLSVKGKEPIAAADLQTGGNEQKAVVMFFFPKTQPIDADDKEVEFSSKFGPVSVKQKFKLKEMMFNGKLEL